MPERPPLAVPHHYTRVPTSPHASSFNATQPNSSDTDDAPDPESQPFLGARNPSDYSLLSTPSVSTSSSSRPTKTKHKRPPRLRRLGSRRDARGRRRRSPPIYALPAVLSVSLLALVGLAIWNLSGWGGKCAIPWLCDILGGAKEEYDSVWARNAGPYAPWISYGHGGADKGLPPGCVVDQVSILHRHTGRYPTPGSAERIRSTLTKLANRGIYAPNNRPDLAFLRGADLTLDSWKMGELTDSGRLAAYRSGETYAGRYKFLQEQEGLFSRSTDKPRVLETANFWLDGYHGREYVVGDDERVGHVEPDLVIPEGSDKNNTLSVHNCHAFEAIEPRHSVAKIASLLPLLQPAADRLNTLLDPQPPLEPSDIRNIGAMCGFDSAAHAEWEGWSKWCKMLKRAEWEVAGYITDVERWYDVGDGSRFGQIMGAGYVNELLARLQDMAPVDTTTTNRTLDANPATFPRGGNRIFIDFSHDNEMISILSALGVRKLRRKMPIDSLPLDAEDRRFVLAKLVPFGGRWAFERVVCEPGAAEAASRGGPGHAGARVKTARHARPKEKRTFVRILLNDLPAHVNHISCRSSDLHDYMLCELHNFVESQIWSWDDVDWSDCEVKEHKGSRPEPPQNGNVSMARREEWYW